jgi:hypothetical protein
MSNRRPTGPRAGLAGATPPGVHAADCRCGVPVAAPAPVYRFDFGQLLIIFIDKLAILTKGCVMEKETFIGKRVKFTVDAFWIGLVEGIVIKEFKNGKVAVQVERPNKVFHVKQTDITVL